MTRDELLKELETIGHHLKQWAEPSSWKPGEEARAKAFARPLKAARVAFGSIRDGHEPRSVLEWMLTQLDSGTAEAVAVRALIRNFPHPDA